MNYVSFGEGLARRMSYRQQFWFLPDAGIQRHHLQSAPVSLAIALS